MSGTKGPPLMGVSRSHHKPAGEAGDVIASTFGNRICREEITEKLSRGAGYQFCTGFVWSSQRTGEEREYPRQEGSDSLKTFQKQLLSFHRVLKNKRMQAHLPSLEGLSMGRARIL